MSARPLRLVAAVMLVSLAAGACAAPTGPDDPASGINTTEATPLGTEHQGSDSVRGVDMAPQHTEHQGSDS